MGGGAERSAIAPEGDVAPSRARSCRRGWHRHIIEEGKTKLMTDQDLDQIRVVLRDALAPLEGRLTGVESRFAGVEGRLGGVETRLAGVETNMAVQIETLTALRTEVTAIKSEIDAWPDLHFLQAAAQRAQRENTEAREHRRYIEIKLGEIYGSMATSSEITKLREEVSSSIAREDALDLRISAIELRLGIRNPLAPTE